MPNESQTVAFPNYVPTRTQQITFAGGLNASLTPHTIGADEVASSTNIDYSLEWGGAPCRRGNAVYAWEAGQGVSAINFQLIGRNYALSTGTWNDPAIPWIVAADSGFTYLGSGTNTLAPITLGKATNAAAGTFSGGATTAVFPVITQYHDYVYVGNGTSAFRTNGTNTLDWILPQADTPTVTFAQQGTFTGTGNQAGAFVGYSGTLTATEGTVTASSTSSYFGNSGGVIITTATTGTGSRIVLQANTSTTNWENSVVFLTTPTGTSVTTGAGTYTLGGGIDFHQGWPSGDIDGGTGTYTATATATQTMSIGAYGTDYTLCGLIDQQSVVSISRDLSIGDTTFTNYWHVETTPATIRDAITDPLSLALAAQGFSNLTDQSQAINSSRMGVGIPNRGNVPTPMPVYRKTGSKVTSDVSATPWGVARSDYIFIGTLPTPDFSNIQAVRITIEFNTTGKQVLIGGFVTYGAQGWCLNDQNAGISYYQTFARVENNIIVAEGAPSNPSPPTKAQYAYGMITCASNSNTTAGITHRVFYRTGGLLQDAYRIGSCTITASGTATIYDYNNPDMKIINRPVMRRFLWSQWPSASAGTGLPGVNCVSESWQDSLWLGVKNYLYWTYPGQPSQINDASQITVGDGGDVIQGIIPYVNLVVVKQASVWEVTGTIGSAGEGLSLERAGARRGSAAPKTCIKTPHGILLFSYDGISMYRPGYGVDQDLSWVYDKIGDLWKGTAATDPAGFKGRIPALNQSAIFNSCATYKDEKIYLAVPTGTNTLPDTMFVLDMPRQRVWMFTYPFKVNSLFWDRVGNRLMAGTDKGTMQQLEIGLSDATVTNTTQGISWSFRTRAWSTPTDVILENLQTEVVGTLTQSATADGTGYSIGTFSDASKVWQPGSLQGTIGDNVYFTFNGTQSAAQQEVYQMQFDMIPQAPKVLYFETDWVTVPSENYVKTWLAQIDLLGGTCTATLLVDNIAVQTNTLTGVGNKTWFEIGLPNITIGKAVKAIYKSTTNFKYYNTEFEQEPKPFNKKTWLVTYKKLGGSTQLDMARFYAMDIEGTLTATVTNTWIIDGVAFTTDTFTISAVNSGETLGVGRMYADQIPFPPGARGYLFQQQCTSAQNFRVWKAHLDIDRIGVKGLSRVTLVGTPQAS